MFTATVNAAWINESLTASESQRMHESVIRLLNCARRVTEHLPAAQRVHDFASLRRRMDVSAATLTNWKSRGVSLEGLLSAEALFGCPAAWVRDGNGEHWTYPQTPDEGGSIMPVAREMSYRQQTVTPPHVAWDALMKTPLEAEFQTTAADDSMAPEVPRGARIIFVTGLQPNAGDFVLVADNQGVHYLREYRQLRPGHWQAHALNAAYLPLDSERDGLRVLAVFDGMRGRRSSRG
jgi:hypothetical protein